MAVKIQLRGDTASNWTAANPVLSERELGIETDTLAYKIGNGITAWNSLLYRELTPTFSNMVMSAIADPSTPAPGHLDFYAKAVCGRVMPKWCGPSGVNTPVQPAMFQNSVFLLSPNTTSTLSTVGTSAVSTGTVTTPVPNIGSFGLVTNFATTAIAASTAGTGFSVNMLSSSSDFAACGGFFAVLRLIWPDADYGAGATGSRHFVGLTDAVLSTLIATDNPAGNRIGFALSTVLGETNWMLTTKNGVTETRISIGVPFAPNHLYDFFLRAPAGATEINWRIDDLTAGTSVEGVTDDTLPLSSALMKAGVQITTLTTLVRNVRMKKIYAETDG